MKYFLISLMFCSSLFAQLNRWGWNSHEYINEHAVDYLPREMSVFQEHRDYLREHSTDPDADALPGFYHYIDIDYYPEFFTGTLPHDLDSLIALYNLSVIEDNGIVPWIIEELTDSLTNLMAASDWDNVWQTAAELGHYVADSHEPLHLTVNYNGQFTGNNGIHSRYETRMINPRLSEIPLPTGTGVYWPNVIDSVFLFIEEVYPYVDSILIADDLATAQDPNYNTTYFNIMWQELENLTIICIHKAILDLASLWRTAWENAGRPLPVSIETVDQIPEEHFLAEAYPNPFNPATTIEYSIPVNSRQYSVGSKKKSDDRKQNSENRTLSQSFNQQIIQSNSGMVSVKLIIYDILGRHISTLVNEQQRPGKYQVKFTADNLTSGVYFYSLETSSGFVQSKKIVLLK